MKAYLLVLHLIKLDLLTNRFHYLSLVSNQSMNPSVNSIHAKVRQSAVLTTYTPVLFRECFFAMTDTINHENMGIILARMPRVVFDSDTKNHFFSEYERIEARSVDILKISFTWRITILVWLILLSLNL